MKPITKRKDIPDDGIQESNEQEEHLYRFWINHFSNSHPNTTSENRRISLIYLFVFVSSLILLTLVYLFKQDQTLIKALVVLGLLGIPVILSVIRVKSIHPKTENLGEGNVETKSYDQHEKKIFEMQEDNLQKSINMERRSLFLRDYFTKAINWLTPTYNELTTYLTALTCVVIFLTHEEFRQFIFEAPTGEGAGEANFAFLTLGIIAALGFIFSTIHVFKIQEKSGFEKICIGVFGMIANGVAGMVSGIEMLPSKLSILIIFPIWNFLMGA